MPKAPPINKIEMVVVPSVSNLAKPYGYLSDGSFRDNRQQNKVTKSPSKSRSKRQFYHSNVCHVQLTNHLESARRLQARKLNAYTILRNP